jgi:hypothetical protein
VFMCVRFMHVYAQWYNFQLLAIWTMAMDTVQHASVCTNDDTK